MPKTNFSFTDEAIAEIATAVIDTSFPYADWGHAAHFALALWLLRNPDVLEAEGGIEAILRRYNAAVGIPDVPTRGYHATITTASMCAAQWFVSNHEPDTGLAEILDELMQGEPGEPKWLLRYWSKEKLDSLPARRAWLEPDLMPLPYAKSRIVTEGQ